MVVEEWARCSDASSTVLQQRLLKRVSKHVAVNMRVVVLCMWTLSQLLLPLGSKQQWTRSGGPSHRVRLKIVYSPVGAHPTHFEAAASILG